MSLFLGAEDIDIESDQKVSSANTARAIRRIELGRTQVRSPLLLANAVLQALVLALANARQLTAILQRLRLAIQVDRHGELVAEQLGKPFRDLNTLLDS